MHEENVHLLRKEASRLLSLQIELLERIRQAPHVLSASERNAEQTFDIQSVPQKIEMLEGEVRKLAIMDLVFAVVGTMKAGKSTTINAIVGAEVLPNRNGAMTALPTLIRHTPGVQQPRLFLPHVEPLNQLIGSLRDGLLEKGQSPDSAWIHKLHESLSDEEISSLRERILSGTPLSAKNEGADAIFASLKAINDLVRLARALNMEFPFREYSRIENLPVIEVEFAHLRGPDGAQGYLTLLDTPGPDEADQPYFRQMLRDQLAKASAVLAVLNYTKLKDEGDANFRAEVARIAKTAEGRLYVFVNRFDERDRNGDNEEQVRKKVMALMNRAVPKDRIYPVSSKQGFLATRAKSEIVLHGKLPDHGRHPWVADFGRDVLGSRWMDKIYDPKEVGQAADDLWEESLFEKPLQQVIGETHAKAAILAVDSSVRKMVDVSMDAKNFLGSQRGALKKNLGEIRKEIEALQRDIDDLTSHKKAVDRDVKSALKRVKCGIQESSESVHKEVLGILQEYFTEGRRIEADQHFNKEDREARPLPVTKETADHLSQSIDNLFARVIKTLESTVLTKGRDTGLDFDPQSTSIKFDSRKSAEKFLTAVEKSIENAMAKAQVAMRDEIKLQLQEFDGELQEHVIAAEELLKRIKGRTTDFDLAFHVPDVRAVAFDISASDVMGEAIKATAETKTRHRRKDNMWGTVCSWFSTDDWGWETYSEEVEVYVIDIKTIQKDVTSGVAEVFEVVKETSLGDIERQLGEQVDAFFAALEKKIEHIRGDRIASQKIQEKTEGEKKILGEELTRLERPVPGLLRDSVELAKQVQALLDSAPIERSAAP